MATTVTSAFDQLLADLRLTDRQRDIAAGRMSHLRTFFAKNYVLAKAPWAIGSYGRETIIRWERDIDVMVALSANDYWTRYQANSSTFLRWLRDSLNMAYPGSEVGTRQIAIRMFLGDDLHVDLVPGFYRTGGGFWVPDGSGGWQATNPPYHDELMTNANVRLGSHLEPLVRVMKAWNTAGNGGRLRSFHLEMIVERVWQSATSLSPMPSTVAETLRCAAGWVRSSFLDPWSGSGAFLDSYLSSSVREAVAKTLDEDAVRAKDGVAYAAEGHTAAAFDRWDVVFGRTFPAYG